MDKPQQKVYIPDFKTKKMLECDVEDLKEYGNCISSTSRGPASLNLLASVGIALAAPIQNKVNVPFKRFGIGIFCFLAGSIFTDLYAASVCYPVLEKIKAKAEERDGKIEESGDNATGESYEQKTLDVSPLEHGSLDLSPPAGFSLDYSFRPESFNEDKKDEMNELKPSTYEELRLRSRAELKKSGSTSKMETPEKRDFGDDKWEFGSNIGPKKTNIYGDVLE